MVAVPKTDYSPVELQAGYVAMVVADKGGVENSTPTETQFLGTMSHRGITKMAPKLIDATEAAASTDAFKKLGASSEALLEQILANPENSPQFAQDVEALLEQTETLFAAGLPEGSVALKELREGISSMRTMFQQTRMEGEVGASAPPPAAAAPESEAGQGPADSPEASGQPEGSSGTSGQSLNDARLNMMMAILSAQAAVSDKTYAQMQSEAVTSEASLNIIEGNRIVSIENNNEQLANEKAAQKKHFWQMFGIITASVVASIAGAVLTVVTVGAAAGIEAGIIAGSVALCTSAALMTMQYTGAMDAMFSGINSPGLQFLAEMAFVVAVSLLSAGIATAGTLATAATTVATEAGTIAVTEAGTVAAEQGIQTGATLGMEEAGSEALEAAAKKSAMKIGKTVAFATAVQATMSTSAIQDLAQFQVNLFCDMGGWDKDSKDAKIAALTLQIVYTLIFMVATGLIAKGMMSGTMSELGGASKLGMSTATTAALSYTQTGMSVTSGMFKAFSSVMGGLGAKNQFRIAELQKEAGVIQASTENAENLSEQNDQAIKATQKQSAEEQQGFQQLIQGWNEFFNDMKTVAELLRG